VSLGGLDDVSGGRLDTRKKGNGICQCCRFKDEIKNQTGNAVASTRKQRRTLEGEKKNTKCRLQKIGPD